MDNTRKFDWKEYNKVDSENKFNELLSDWDVIGIRMSQADEDQIYSFQHKLSSKNNEYLKLREYLECAYKTIYNNLIQKGESKKFKYRIDIYFGYILYTYLNKEYGFDEYYANRDDIWRFLSLEILPDLVLHRFNDLDDDYKRERFYSMPRRIWLKYLWWYIHLTFQQGSDEKESKRKTMKCLQYFNTDYIVQLTERRGSGFDVELERRIIANIAKEYEKNPNRINFIRYVTRKVKVVHTAKKMVYIPLTKEQDEKFIDSIIKECIELYEEEYGKN